MGSETTSAQLQIILFGRLAEAIAPTVRIEVSGKCSVRELRSLLARRFPDAAPLLQAPGVRGCVANAIVPDSHIVSPGDEVEFLPAVSGG